MKRILSAAFGMLTLASIAGTANAADLSRRYEAVNKAPAFVQVYNWTGAYIGINGGGAWGTSSFDGPPATGSFSTSGGLIGGTLGYNWQAGQAVFGVEGDLDWSGLTGSTSAAVCVGCSTRNTYLGTARGRLGWAFDRFMPYVTGGLAFGDIRATGPAAFAGASSNQVGWTLGAGLEFALAQNWTAKAEYLYADLGSFNCGGACGVPPIGPDNVTLRTNIFRGGINYRF
jgi:outer membrane immunogenic protein